MQYAGFTYYLLTGRPRRRATRSRATRSRVPLLLLLLLLHLLLHLLLLLLAVAAVAAAAAAAAALVAAVVVAPLVVLVRVASSSWQRLARLPLAQARPQELSTAARACRGTLEMGTAQPCCTRTTQVWTLLQVVLEASSKLEVEQLLPHSSENRPCA